MKRLFPQFASVLVLAQLSILAAAVAFGQTAPQVPQAAERSFQAAVQAYQSQNFKAAAGILAPLLKQYPGSFELNELSGLVMAAMGENAKADPLFRKAVHINPRSAAAHTNWATNLMQMNRASAAEAEFIAAQKLDPQGYEPNHNLGEFYVHSNKLEEAIPCLEKAQQAQPNSYENGYDLALAEVEAGKYAAAKDLIQSLLRLQNQADLHALLGEINEKTGHFIESAREYQQAAQMDPSENNIFAWGLELLLHHTLEPAVQVYTRGAQLYPQSSRMQVALGIALFSRTHYDRAIQAFCRAIDLAPGDPRPYAFLGQVYDIAPHQADQVTHRLAQFVKVAPNDPRAYFYYAMSLWKGERIQSSPEQIAQVESLLKKATELDPGYAAAHLQLGILESQQTRLPDAIAQYRLAIKSDPRVADAHYRLAQALVRSGQRQEAQEEFKTFNNLHIQETAADTKKRQQVMEFVYTLKNSSPSSDDSKQPPAAPPASAAKPD